MFYLILSVIGALIVLLLLLVCVFAVHLVFTRRKYAHIPGPPVTSFFMGNIGELMSHRSNGIHMHHKYIEWHMEYGKVIVIWFANMPFITVGDPEIIKDILILKNLPKHSLAYGNLAYLYGQRFLGQGLVTNMDVESWKTRRTTLNPAFHRKCLKDLMKSFNSTANLLLEHLSTVADGKTEVSIFNEFSRAALDVICKVFKEVIACMAGVRRGGRGGEMSERVKEMRVQGAGRALLIKKIMPNPVNCEMCGYENDPIRIMPLFRGKVCRYQ